MEQSALLKNVSHLSLVEPNPVLVEHAKKRAESVQNRIADRITGFAGSMRFVYLHALLFAVWMIVFEKSPWPTLTLMVSLEAIFLSTFVMIGQNRQASIQQAKADHDFVSGEKELRTNTELTRLVHQLTTEIHSHLISAPNGTTPTAGGTDVAAGPAIRKSERPLGLP